VQQSYSTDYFRRRRMGLALDRPFDRQSPALKAYRRAARMLRVRPGMRLLDAGCGLGAGAWLLAGLGAEVTALDVSSAAIAWARETYGPVPLPPGGSLHFELVDLTTWAPEPHFDGVILADVLEHVSRPAGVDLLRRLLGALDVREAPPRGWGDGLFLHLPITANLIDWPLLVKNRLLLRRLRGQVLDHHGDPTHRARYGLDDLLPLTRAAGARIVQIELRVYRPRIKPLERVMLDLRPHLLTRLGGSVVTDCDAVVLPELVAALRLAPPDGEGAAIEEI